MRLSSARRALDKAVTAEAGRPREEPVTPLRNLPMKEVVS
jgi:hypothetical protein